MRHATGLFALPLLAAAALADPAPRPQPDPDALSSKATLLAPIQVGSLTLTPIVATTAAAPADKAAPELLVLDEAMASKQVRIEEVAGGDVNNLTMINRAAKPVFVLAGEVILGGKQDRIVGRNTIVPAKTTQLVPVYCVEHGRWAGDTKEFTSAKALAHGRLRVQASFATQQDVWDEVSAKNEKRKTTSKTGTYRKIATQQSDGTLASYEKKIRAAIDRLPAADRGRMIGYAVAVDGAVASVDLFASPALFKKLEGKLVRSYVTEAIDVAARPDVKPPTASDVKAFMADADRAPRRPSYKTDAAGTSGNVGAHAAKSTVQLGADASAPAAYESYLAH